MLRSQTPSAQRRLKEQDTVNQLSTGRVTKRVKYNDQIDDDQNDDEATLAVKEAIKIHLKLLNESREKHEAFIQSTLKKPFRIPIPGYGAHSEEFQSRSRNRIRAALHDPLDPNALVLYYPPEYTRQELLRNKDELLVHVVVDPCLCRVLRPHQREGVSFMYRCVTGEQIENYYGCIMADDMGLGKTLQCITLLWTLLRQGPDCKPIIDNCIIVCPSSLVTNWHSEIKKWLGIRLSALAIGGEGKGGKEETIKKLDVFQRQKTTGVRRAMNPVLIISYQTLRNYVNLLKDCQFGLMICDEGHTLKNENALTYNAIQTLNCKRKIIISGTPVQNDLLEYYSLVNFVNPGLLGTTSEFKKKYENPILLGRDADASPERYALGQERLKEMLNIVYKCMIRRTSLLLSKYLPLKYEMVVCCPLAPIQKTLYEYFLKSKNVQNALRKADGDIIKGKKGAGTNTLKAILFLKNLCGHPKLAYDVSVGRAEKDEAADVSAFEGIDKLFPQEISRSGRSYVFNPELSSKMILLDSMLALIKSTTDDKVVLISNYTTTLDMFIELCRLRNYKYIRLDGTTTTKKRGELVARFNDPTNDEFIFMLSSKAGGCGINLIGANRLFMFDPDWNPANDGQAMARVWRDGQKKTCYLYRLMCTGTIEEKIFQRQSHKKALSNCVVDKQEDVERHFSVADLKELFRLENETVKSDTHSKFSCERCRDNRQIKPPPAKADCSSDLKDWHHCYDANVVPDQALKKAWHHAKVSFVFYQRQDKPVCTTPLPSPQTETRDAA
ncbi:DNA repair and recombination protein RAD54-like protein, partial [Fragariocoptes setiger]